MTAESLLDLQPDFVLEVYQTVDTESGKPTQEASADLNRLLTVLDAKNFYIEIRPGNIKTLLVFVKLNDLDLTKAIEEDKINDWSYGVNNELLSLGVQLDSLTTAEKLRIIYQILVTPISFGGCGITPTVGDWNFVRALVPVSNYEVLTKKYLETKLENSAFNDAANASNIAFILENFGTKYAFYHYFINSYNSWLLPLTVVGFLSNLVFARYSIFYTVVNLLWAIGFYLYWKFTQLKLSKQWGVSKNVEEAELPKSDANLDEPSYKRFLKQLSFIPTSLAFAGWLVAVQFACFIVEIFLNEVYDGWLSPYLGLVPTILLTVSVPIVTAAYNKFVDRSLDYESHAKASTFNYSKIIKTFVFNFLTSYMALLITSFLYLPFGFKLNGYLPAVGNSLNSYVNISVKRENFSINAERLNGQYQFFILINQIIGTVLKYVLPPLLAKVLAHPTVKGLLGQKEEVVLNYRDSETEKEYLADIRSMLQLPEYNVDDDYRALVLQFGFLVLFGPIWSLGPLISLVINLIQQKMDFVKLFKSVKTPVPARSKSIFPWDDFMKVLILIGSASSVTIAIMYNGDIVSSASRSAVGIRWWKIVGPAFVAEHFVIFTIWAGEKALDHYADYLERQEANVDEDVTIRTKYLDSVYQRKSIEGGEGKNLNNIQDLLAVSAIFPQQLTKANTLPVAGGEKSAIEKDLHKIDSKIEKTAREKAELDRLYEEKNNQIKATETSHVKKLEELAGASTAIDTHSKSLIEEKNTILSDLEQQTSPKIAQLEKLKAEKARLEALKQEKTIDQPNIGGLSGVKPAAVSAVATATGVATTAAAAVQSKIVDLQGKGTTDATGEESGSSAAHKFDLQDGDRIITSQANVDGEIKPVVATIDNNEHFQPDENNDIEIIDGGEINGNESGSLAESADTTTATSGTSSDPLKTPSKSVKGKKSKTPLKSLFKKIH